jgi:hypothetical protein
MIEQARCKGAPARLVHRQAEQRQRGRVARRNFSEQGAQAQIPGGVVRQQPQPRGTVALAPPPGIDEDAYPGLAAAGIDGVQVHGPDGRPVRRLKHQPHTPLGKRIRVGRRIAQERLVCDRGQPGADPPVLGPVFPAVQLGGICRL